MIIISVIKKSLSLISKGILLLAVFTVVIGLFFRFTSRNQVGIPTQDPLVAQRAAIYAFLKTPDFQKTPEDKAKIKLAGMFICNMIGEGCSKNPDEADKYYNSSILGRVGSFISLPYVSMPASGIQYTMQKIEDAGFIPKIYAAEGIGFAAIKPFADIWRVFRDISYLLLVILLISIGFMIMFRMKIDPQTVISIENALPRIILTLIFVTFSFPIAGFMIDLMYVFMFISIALLAKLDTTTTITQFQNMYITGSLMAVWDSMITQKSIIPLWGNITTLTSVGGALANTLPSIINNSIRVLGVYIFVVYGVARISSGLGLNAAAKVLNNLNIFGNSLGSAPGAILGVGWRFIVITIFSLILIFKGASWIFAILVFFTMVLLLFRIFFMLFAAYIKIILLVIFSPILLLFQSIPGKNPFKYWIKSMSGELMTFPLVVIFLMVGRMLANLYTAPNGNVWQPPFIYGIEAKDLAILLGIGIMFMIPKLVKVIKEYMGIQSIPAGFGIGTFFEGGTTAFTGAQQSIGTFGSLASMPGLSFLQKSKLGQTILPPTAQQSMTDALEKFFPKKPDPSP